MIQIKTKLTPAILKQQRFKKYLGRRVEIIIREIEDEKTDASWNYSGAINLGGQLDKQNIRDLANG